MRVIFEATDPSTTCAQGLRVVARQARTTSTGPAEPFDPNMRPQFGSCKDGQWQGTCREKWKVPPRPRDHRLCREIRPKPVICLLK